MSEKLSRNKQKLKRPIILLLIGIVFLALGGAGEFIFPESDGAWKNIGVMRTFNLGLAIIVLGAYALHRRADKSKFRDLDLYTSFGLSVSIPLLNELSLRMFTHLSIQHRGIAFLTLFGLSCLVLHAAATVREENRRSHLSPGAAPTVIDENT